MTIPKRIQADLKKKQWGVVGTGGVQICSWNKKVLQGKHACYKQHFYGVHTHKCMQFSPSAMWCSNECIFCWRPTEYMNPGEFQLENEPEEIVEGLIEERRKLLSGFGGRTNMDLELWKDSLEPDHYAISLSGEPCIYSKLPQLISYLKKKKARTIFLVTNGTYPEMIEKMAEQEALPSQLYVSIVAPNKTLYKKIVRPRLKDAWERFNEALSLLKGIKTRTVLRFTLIKGLNDSAATMKQFAALFNKTQASFIEVKAYMFLGYSRKRLKIENMPYHKHVKSYSESLIKLLPEYEIAREHPPSRIVLLKHKSVKQLEL